MKRRLFWKILFAFWLTFLAMTQGVWLLFEMTRDRRPVPERPMAEAVAPLLLDMARDAIARSGTDGFGDLLARLPADQRRRLDLVEAPRGQRTDQQQSISRRAQAPDGRAYTIRYWFHAPRHRLFPFNAPPELLIVGLIGGLGFASLLAWYLTAPIRRLQGGFDRLARGDLGVRLSATMGGRRDEIADLAGDFDRMAQRLEQLVAARDRLLHDVSHELRSPLARLQLAVGLSRQAPARLPASLDRIEREIERLDMLVGELLALARAEHGDVAGEAFFDLAGVVASVVDDARFEAQSNRVDILLQEDPAMGEDAPPLCGDAALVRRAIDNIVRNALRFSPMTGTVRVATRHDSAAAEYCVIVADQGPGVPAEELATIFDPFVRGADGGKGFGLGLAIAHRAIIAHGGRVAARNMVGGGLEIAVTFPHGAGRQARA